MNTSEFEQKVGQFTRQLDDVRDRFNALARESAELLAARQGQVVATAKQLREPVGAALDRLPATARPGWIPVALLAVVAVLVPLALTHGRSRATKLLETVATEVRKATGSAGPSGAR